MSFLGSPDRRYRLLYKPLVFVACLVPLAWAVAGVLGLPVPRPGSRPGAARARHLRPLGAQPLLLTLTVTPLRQLTGQSRLLLLRRMLGLFAFSYVLLHFMVYAGPFESFSGAAIVKDIAKRPYITIGFLALLLLVPLAVTSTNAMMRRLRRRWQRLHRLVYLIAVLGVWHYWWQVKKDIREPLIYATLLALLLGWRAWRGGARRYIEVRASQSSGNSRKRSAFARYDTPAVPPVPGL